MKIFLSSVFDQLLLFLSSRFSLSFVSLLVVCLPVKPAAGFHQVPDLICVFDAERRVLGLFVLF